MGVVVIFIITPSDNWLDCIFLRCQPPSTTPHPPILQPSRSPEETASNCGGDCWSRGDPTQLPLDLRGALDSILFLILLVFVSADIFCLGFWSFVDGDSAWRAVGRPPHSSPNQSNGEGKPSRNGSQQPPGCLSQRSQVLTVDVSA